MFIKVKETRINTDHITDYGMLANGDLYIAVLHNVEISILRNVDVQKTLLQLDRVLNPKHIDIFEVKK